MTSQANNKTHQKYHLGQLVLAVSCLLGTSAYACTTPKSSYKNLSCTSANDVFLASTDAGRPAALVDKNGKKTADLFAYDAILAKHFSHGLVPVRKAGKVGYIDKRGKVVIPIIYDNLGGSHWARAVANHRIIVKKSGAFGVIDTQGKVIVDFSNNISHISDYRNNTATITRLGKKTTINQQGKSINTQNQNTRINQNKTQKTSSTQPNKKPKTDVPFFARQKDGKWGFVDMEGVPMIVYAFDEVRPYHDGIAGVRIGDTWGFINKAGEVVIDFRFSHKHILNSDNYRGDIAFIFINNQAWVGQKDGKNQCINKKGEAIKCDFDERDLNTLTAERLRLTPSVSNLSSTNEQATINTPKTLVTEQNKLKNSDIKIDEKPQAINQVQTLLPNNHQATDTTNTTAKTPNNNPSIPASNDGNSNNHAPIQATIDSTNNIAQNAKNSSAQDNNTPTDQGNTTTDHAVQTLANQSIASQITPEQPNNEQKDNPSVLLSDNITSDKTTILVNQPEDQNSIEGKPSTTAQETPPIDNQDNSKSNLQVVQTPEKPNHSKTDNSPEAINTNNTSSTTNSQITENTPEYEIADGTVFSPLTTTAQNGTFFFGTYANIDISEDEDIADNHRQTDDNSETNIDQ